MNKKFKLQWNFTCYPYVWSIKGRLPLCISELKDRSKKILAARLSIAIYNGTTDVYIPEGKGVIQINKYTYKPTTDIISDFEFMNSLTENGILSTEI